MSSLGRFFRVTCLSPSLPVPYPIARSLSSLSSSSSASLSLHCSRSSVVHRTSQTVVHPLRPCTYSTHYSSINISHVFGLGYRQPTQSIHTSFSIRWFCSSSTRFSFPPTNCSSFVLSSSSFPSSSPVIRRQYYRIRNARCLSTAVSPSSPSNPNDPIDTTLYKDQNSTWVDRYAPSSLIPYLKLTRIDRPIGTWLVLLPGWWGLSWCYQPSSAALATLSSSSSSSTDLYSIFSILFSSVPFDLYVYFGIGAFLMRSAGCTVNDIWDRHYDRLVARTRQRPLASNQLQLWKAILFLLVQLLGGLFILLQLNILTLYVGILAVPLVCIYPLMKRYTYFPQFILGLAMSYGIWMGYSSSLDRSVSTWDRLRLFFTPNNDNNGNSDRSLSSLVTFLLPSRTYLSSLFPSTSSTLSTVTVPWLSLTDSLRVLIPFYFGAVNWTIVYDTIYAYQDIQDDKRLGLKSTAIWMGNKGKIILSFLSICGVGLPWYIAGYQDTAKIGSLYSMSVSLAVLHLLYQCQSMDINDRMNLTKRFTWNRYIGWIMLGGILGGRLQTALLTTTTEAS